MTPDAKNLKEIVELLPSGIKTFFEAFKDGLVAKGSKMSFTNKNGRQIDIVCDDVFGKHLAENGYIADVRRIAHVGDREVWINYQFVKDKGVEALEVFETTPRGNISHLHNSITINQNGSFERFIYKGTARNPVYATKSEDNSRIYNAEQVKNMVNYVRNGGNLSI